MNKGDGSGGASGRARIEGGSKGDAYITGAAAKATAQARRRSGAAGFETRLNKRSEPSTRRAIDLLESLFFRP
jgi:ABC-type molybdate transport system substrate-binding protein